MGTVKLDLVNKLYVVLNKLKMQHEAVEKAMDKLEEEKLTRDNKRKEVLLQEIKLVLASLHETDKKLVRNLKSEIFDHNRLVIKLEKEVSKLIDLVNCSNSKDMDTMNEAVMDVIHQTNTPRFGEVSLESGC